MPETLPYQGLVAQDSELAELMESSPLYNERASAPIAGAPERSPFALPGEQGDDDAEGDDDLADEFAFSSEYEQQRPAIEDDQSADPEVDGEDLEQESVVPPTTAPLDLLGHMRQIFQEPAPGTPQAQSPVPAPPEEYRRLLDDRSYEQELRAVANEFLPDFRAAEAAGNHERMQSVALRYEARKERLEVTRQHAHMMVQMHQMASEYTRMRTIAEAAARVVTAFVMGQELGIDSAHLLVHPGTGKPVTTRQEMEGLAAMLAKQKQAARKTQQAARRPAPSLSGGGAAPEGGTREQRGQRNMARLNPFGKEFDRIERQLLAGRPVDPSRIGRPRRRAAS